MPQRKTGKKPPRPSFQNEGRPTTAASSPPTHSGGTRHPLPQSGALNPPFDARMRRVGNPLMQAHLIKRGWIQTVTGDKRVNFLFNPASINMAHTEDPNAKSPTMAPEASDPGNVDYVSQSSTGVSLLYDRTYEMFSLPKGGDAAAANSFGVMADIAAWYVFLNMLQEMPKDWLSTIPVSPVQRVPAYLYVGSLMPFYGFVNSLNVTVTHWTLDMIPQRAKIDVGFVTLPKGEAVANPPFIGPTTGSVGQGLIDSIDVFGDPDYGTLGDAFNSGIDFFDDDSNAIADFLEDGLLG